MFTVAAKAISRWETASKPLAANSRSAVSSSFVLVSVSGGRAVGVQPSDDSSIKVTVLAMLTPLEFVEPALSGHPENFATASPGKRRAQIQTSAGLNSTSILWVHR